MSGFFGQAAGLIFAGVSAATDYARGKFMFLSRMCIPARVKSDICRASKFQKLKSYDVITFFVF